MKYTMLLLPLLALPAAAQDDMYKTLALGDRVQITFRSGNTITGRLVPSPLSLQGKPKEGPRVALASGPFQIMFFREEKDDVSDQQALIFESWIKRHADGKLEILKKGEKVDTWQLYDIQATPGLVFVDRNTGRTISAVGLQSETKLDELLARLRSKGGEGDAPDYVKERNLTVDMSWEYPGLNGTMTVDKKEIRLIKKLQNLDEKTIQALTAEKKKVQAELERQNSELRKANAEREKRAQDEIEERRKADEEKIQATGQEAELRLKLDKLKKYKDILARFPPSSWSEKRLKEISNKAATRIPVTPDEREFMTSFALWNEAVAAQEADKKAAEDKKKEGKKEEKKPEEKK